MTLAASALRNLPAPAKVNLFLHVTGKRADGYHTLETVFQLIDLCDYLDIELRQDGNIVRTSQHDGVPEQTDLCVRAALLLQQHAGRNLGANIHLTKNIPMGGGLGGGSSDAATVLIALNYLWSCGLSRPELARLGLKLGADVPVFVMGRNAYATGIGERLHPLTLPMRSFVVVKPAAHVPTPAIFGAPELTRNTKPIKMEGFTRSGQHLPGRNDLEPVAAGRFKSVAAALDALKAIASKQGLDPSSVRMSGSGACVFVALDSQANGAEQGSETQNIANQIKQEVSKKRLGKVFVATSLPRHPLLML